MADDDTYIFTDNLKQFMSKNDYKLPLVFGFQWNVIVPNGYLAGGSGILFTRYIRLFSCVK